MVETVKKPSSNRSAKERRNTLFRVLDGVLSTAHKKIHAGGNSDRAKQGWARVLVSAVSTYGGLLKDEELELRVIALEEKLKNSILIPKPSKEELEQMEKEDQESSQHKSKLHCSIHSISLMARQNLETTKILSAFTYTRIYSHRRRNRPAHSRKRKKTAAILQTLKETGMRIGECLSLKWTALNEQANILTLNTPEKNSLPRIFNISPKLVMILQSQPKIKEKIFGLTKPKHAQSNYSRSRKAIARKVGNPRLAKIHFHLIRHWFGTMEYHKKPDPDYVRRRLGHRSLQSTQIYINMEQALFSNSTNEYHVKIAESVEQAMALIEVGFEYVTGEYNDGGKIFKKRK